MTNTTILKLPPEILYHIFDHCDTYTIFHSIGHVCKHLHNVIIEYKPHKLEFTSSPRYNFELIFRLTSLDVLTSLVICEGKRDQISRCIRHIGSCRLTRLRSLSLDSVREEELRHFLEHIVTNALVSLTVRLVNHGNKSWLPHGMVAAISRLNIKKLCLIDFSNIAGYTLVPKHCCIEHVTISTCSYTECKEMLHRMPQLRELVIDKYTHEYDYTTISTSDLQFQRSLISLTINDCKSSMFELKSLLSLTPGICYLKLICDCATLGNNSISDGAYWEEFISSQLLSLSNFEFSFFQKLSRSERVPTLDKLIASFQTPHWLNKRWFVTCEYDIVNRELLFYRSGGTYLHKSIEDEKKQRWWLYEKKSFIFTISSKDNVYKIFKSNQRDKV